MKFLLNKLNGASVNGSEDTFNRLKNSASSFKRDSSLDRLSSQQFSAEDFKTLSNNNTAANGPSGIFNQINQRLNSLAEKESFLDKKESLVDRLNQATNRLEGAAPGSRDDIFEEIKNLRKEIKNLDKQEADQDKKPGEDQENQATGEIALEQAQQQPAGTEVKIEVLRKEDQELENQENSRQVSEQEQVQIQVQTNDQERNSALQPDDKPSALASDEEISQKRVARTNTQKELNLEYSIEQKEAVKSEQVRLKERGEENKATIFDEKPTALGEKVGNVEKDFDVKDQSKNGKQFAREELSEVKDTGEKVLESTQSFVDTQKVDSAKSQEKTAGRAGEPSENQISKKEATDTEEDSKQSIRADAKDEDLKEEPVGLSDQDSETTFVANSSQDNPKTSGSGQDTETVSFQPVVKKVNDSQSEPEEASIFSQEDENEDSVTGFFSEKTEFSTLSGDGEIVAEEDNEEADDNPLILNEAVALQSDTRNNNINDQRVSSRARLGERVDTGLQGSAQKTEQEPNKPVNIEANSSGAEKEPNSDVQENAPEQKNTVAKELSIESLKSSIATEKAEIKVERENLAKDVEQAGEELASIASRSSERVNLGEAERLANDIRSKVLAEKETPNNAIGAAIGKGNISKLVSFLASGGGF